MQGNATYIRPKVVGPFPGPCASGSYVHRDALFLEMAHHVGLQHFDILAYIKVMSFLLLINLVRAL
jgi:hypothetical protein